MKHTDQFFDFAAQIGLTKHLGGQEATRELVDRTRITPLSYVLDVGCGVGTTACHLARSMGCRVMGVDINPLMIDRAWERATRLKLTDLVEFQQADAMDLPFENDLFNVVITESVTAFPDDKAKSVREYYRVTKPGGFIGLNEATWLKTPVPDEIQAWASQDLGANVTPLQPGEWIQLMEKTGLVDIFKRTSTISTREESRGILERYGWGGFLNSLVQAFGLYLRSSDYREFVKSIREEGLTPPNLDEYFGYGIYIGKKELFNHN
ncbi:MAG: class I SAM-dependent methyltransferase [Anaerolineales bacterium]|nr:class I SAM-dependent methyltransferase [Anaerolineales bacterium]